VKMVCVHAFSIEKAGKVLVNAEPGDPVNLDQATRRRAEALCANGVVAARAPRPARTPAEQHQHPRTARRGEAA
jgi:hypothetical protein